VHGEECGRCLDARGGELRGGTWRARRTAVADGNGGQGGQSRRRWAVMHGLERATMGDSLGGSADTMMAPLGRVADRPGDPDAKGQGGGTPSAAWRDAPARAL
jgi:hypothetical protein